MAKFDMGEFAKTLAQPVSESGTGREQIEYIDVDLLDSDPGNFYALRDLDDLAANIATIGLQQPIRVRAGEGGHVVIVSGHRRAVAIRKLVAEGRTDLREVPCIRDADDASPALRELRLIYANSSTRALSSSEISQQVEKVRDLLYQLKKEGYEFPGRMRDHVAEACKISKSKLARLDVVRKGLAPDIRKAYWDGPQSKSLSEDAAYTLARLPVDVQRQVVDAYRGQAQGDSGLKYLYAGTVEAVAKATSKIITGRVECPDGGTCSHKDAQVSHAIKVKVKGRWLDCGCEYGCCAKCNSLQSCKAVCPNLIGKQKELKAAAKAERQRETAEKEAKERPSIERVGAIWQRFGALREQAGLTPRQYFEKMEDAADRLEELVARCARYAEEIAVLRERVRPYEDTGLTADVCAEYRKFENEVVASGKTFGRLLELLRADTDGRVVVLPCKVGDTVYRVFAPDGRKPVIQETQVKTLGQAADFVGRIGKPSKFVSVFLTRGEAEKALEVWTHGTD